MSAFENNETKGSNSKVTLFMEKVLKVLALIAGVCLAGIMLLLSVAVIFRYFFNYPIIGVDELVQLGMVFVVMLAMPYCSYTNTHIKVDILEGILSARARYIADIFNGLVGIFFIGILIYMSWLNLLDAIEYEDTTNLIELPIWPAYACLTFSLSLFLIVLCWRLKETLFPTSSSNGSESA